MDAKYPEERGILGPLDEEEEVASGGSTGDTRRVGRLAMGDAAKAEACDRCHTYLKLFYLEQNPRAEPFADDVATLPLDLLMAEAGYARSGVNLFLLSRSGT